MSDRDSSVVSARSIALVAIFLVAATLPPLMASAWLLFGQRSVLAAQTGDVTVHGCIERDAASRVPIYKLVESPGSRVFRLTAPKEVDVPSHVGQTVDATGTIADANGKQTREPEFVIKKLTVVRDSCSSANAR